MREMPTKLWGKLRVYNDRQEKPRMVILVSDVETKEEVFHAVYHDV